MSAFLAFYLFALIESVKIDGQIRNSLSFTNCGRTVWPTSACSFARYSAIFLDIRQEFVGDGLSLKEHFASLLA